MEVNDNAETTTSTTTTTAEKKVPLEIDMNDLLREDHDEPPRELVVVPTKNRRRKREKEKTSTKSDGDDNEPRNSCVGEDLSAMMDSELEAAIERQKKHISAFSSKLPDRGEKLKAKLLCFENELKRRELNRSREVANGFKMPMHSESSNINGALGGSKQAVPSSQPSIKSTFGTSFLKKLDNNSQNLKQNANNQVSNAFSREFSYMNPCDKSKRRSAVKLPQSKRAKSGFSTKDFYAWRPGRQSPRSVGKYMSLNGKQAGKVSSTGSLHPIQEEKSPDSSSIDNRDDSQALDSNGSKDEKTVVLVDEEEPEYIERKLEAKELPSRSSEGKIYYPSREDPESLEIFRSELKCLEPGECLTSTIMNFYIRFLQEVCSPDDSSQHNFYFFNTYFYSKLQEAVAYQKSDKEAFFMKFRRWWKGVNIFQKAYIFLPINEDNHWSLVIICIPDEEDESGLIVLHLDSLGLHSSGSIFNNIKSLLINEWKILNEDVGTVDVPIPERIWRQLARRIEQKTISVPRQTNDYDCGLFVLYYMERFIQDAPKRLSRQDMSMFGKNWFKPQEASSLRKKIKKILQELFHKALIQDDGNWEPVCLSANAEKAKVMDTAGIL